MCSAVPMIESHATYCPRDPETETNLRCGRCSELICPNCLVQTDVGSRCSDCARIRTSPMFQASSGELGKAILAGLGTAIGLSLLAGAVVVLFQIPFFGIIIVGAIGWAVGEVVYRASGYKQSRALQWVAGLSVLSSFLILTIFGDFTAILGLIIGTYYAIQRVKPPRGAS